MEATHIARRRLFGEAAVALLVFLAMVADPATAAEEVHRIDFRQLQQPPDDSAEARNLRIWVPVEHRQKCWVTVQIRDHSGRIVRHLLEKLLGRGYYNLYWDKRDDSGNLVEPGEYYSIMRDACGRHEEATLIATFRKWERLSRVLPPDPSLPRTVRFWLKGDSAAVVLRVLNARDEVIERVADTALDRGYHELNWTPGPETPRGRYWLELSIGDTSHRVTVVHSP